MSAALARTASSTSGVRPAGFGSGFDSGSGACVVAAGDLGVSAAKKYDIQYWSPVDEKYRELTSCSNCTDFQARNLNIRARRKDGSIEVLHTLNGTAVSLARSLVVILENYQNEDGTLTVPEVLQPYMGGRSVL